MQQGSTNTKVQFDIRTFMRKQV